MLVLSRRVSEDIFIGDEIRIRIVRIGPDAVRLGIEAPAHMPILRHDTIVRDQKTDPGSRTESV